MAERKFPEPAPFNDRAEYLDIPLNPVKSSQIESVGYDAATGTLAVKFQRGTTVYQYPNVTPKQFAEFQAADSLGKHFGKHLKTLPFKKFAPAK